MTEFDFDELDKAVSSLMEKTPNLEDTNSTQDDAIALSDNSTATVYDAGSYVKLDEAATVLSNTSSVSDIDFPQAESPAMSHLATSVPSNNAVSTDTDRELSDEKPAPSERAEALFSPEPRQDATKGIVKKRRGTFMDVVHPSSDMRTKQMTAPPRLVPRQEMTISPVDSSLSSSSDSEESLTSSKITEHLPVEPRTSDDRDLATILSDNASYDNDAMASERENTVDSSDGVNLAAGEPLPLTDTGPTTTVNTVSQSTESLFLADAKVEKRPLGVQPVTSEKETMKEESADRPVDLSMKARLPDELSSKIMAIESEREVTKVEHPVLRATPQAPQAQTITPAASPVAVSARPLTAAVPNVKQNSASVEEDHPAIYDPAYYKQEAKPVTKKKSGLWVVLAVIGLIIIGGAGGVLYYFYSTNSF